MLAPLTHHLAETSTTWAQQLGPIIDELIRGLASTPGIKLGRVATPLTQANRSRGRDAVRRRQPATDRKTMAPRPKSSRCESCGVNIENRDRRCKACNADYQTARMAETRAEQWEQRRRTGDDPSHGGTAAIRRGLTNRSHQNAIAAWQPGDQPTDPGYYRTTILPTLTDVRARTIADALQVSDAYARQIRKGTRTPHPRHWPMLQQLGANHSDS